MNIKLYVGTSINTRSCFPERTLHVFLEPMVSSLRVAPRKSEYITTLHVVSKINQLLSLKTDLAKFMSVQKTKYRRLILLEPYKNCYNKLCYSLFAYVFSIILLSLFTEGFVGRSADCSNSRLVGSHGKYQTVKFLINYRQLS